MPPKRPVPASYRRWYEARPAILLKDDPIAWHDAWESYLARPRPEGASEQFILSSSPPTATDELLSYYRGTQRNLCELQYQLSMTRCNLASHHDFDRVWTEWPVQKRKDVVQEAIIRAFTRNPQFLDRAEYCEIRVSFLEPKMLELLNYFVLEDMSQIPAIPKLYPVRVCAVSDARFHEGGKLMLRYVKLIQTYAICSVLGEALCVFLGDPPLPPNEPMKGNFKITARGREVDVEQKKAFKALPAGCEHCRREENTKIRMQICGACKAIGRNMQYCSRACQKADWPRHKIICGKPLTMDTVTSTAVVNSPTARVHTISEITPLNSLRPNRVCSIRPCEGGYKRSPALLRQVNLLQQNPGVDYYFFLPTTTNNVLAVAVPNPKDEERFLAARDNVTSTGDFDSFKRLFVFLKEFTKYLDKFSEADLIAQVNREYGFDITVDDPRLRDESNA